MHYVYHINRTAIGNHQNSHWGFHYIKPASVGSNVQVFAVAFHVIESELYFRLKQTINYGRFNLH